MNQLFTFTLGVLAFVLAALVLFMPLINALQSVLAR